MNKDRGDCSSRVDKWYYDATERDCRRFVYSGCGGNDNRFENYQSCVEQCITVEPTRQPIKPIPTTADSQNLGLYFFTIL